MSNKLKVKIDGQEYTLVSEESREYMLEVSDMVNSKMEEVKFQNARLSLSMAAILVALNLADDMKKDKKEAMIKIEELKKENEELKKRLDAAKQYVQNRASVTPAQNQPGSFKNQGYPYKK